MFDHNKYKLSKKGVENYFWPVDRSDMTSLMNSIIAETTGYFIKLNKENANSEFNDFRITNLYFILKMLNLYQDKLLIKNRIKIGELDLGSSFNGELGYLAIVKNGLRKDFKKKHIISMTLRNYLATIVRRDGFIRKDISSLDINLGKDIICTGVSPLAEKYLKKLNQNAYQIRITDFFPGANSDDLKKNIAKERNEIIIPREYEKYVEIFINLFEQHNINLSENDLKDALEWHKEFLICISYYRDILINQARFIPSKLWTTSAGILWNKILAIEVRKRGGVVTVFDHAYGANLSLSSTMPLVEFQEVDEFVTHSDTFVEYLIDASKNQLYSDKLPNLISIKQ
jgi:hypothetical protein